MDRILVVPFDTHAHLRASCQSRLVRQNFLFQKCVIFFQLLSLWEPELGSSLYCLLHDIISATPDKEDVEMRGFPLPGVDNLTQSIHFLVELIPSSQIKDCGSCISRVTRSLVNHSHLG